MYSRIVAALAAVAAASGIACGSAAGFPSFSGSFPAYTNGAYVEKPTTLETVSGFKVSCPSEETSSEISNATHMRLSVYLFNCASKGLGYCNNSGPGFISFSAVGTLVYLNKERRTVGLRFNNASGQSNSTMTNYYCRTSSVPYYELQNQFVATISPVNRVLHAGEHFIISIKQAKGIQKPESFEGSGPEVLDTSFGGETPIQTGLGMPTIADPLTTEVALVA